MGLIVLPTYYCEANYLQTVHKPPKKFLLRMQSGKLGIMEVKKIDTFPDFGTTCFGVSFEFTKKYYSDTACQKTRGMKLKRLAERIKRWMRESM